MSDRYAGASPAYRAYLIHTRTCAACLHHRPCASAEVIRLAEEQKTLAALRARTGEA